MNTILIHTHRNEIDNNDRINPLPIVFTTWNPMNAFSSAPKAPFVNCAAELKKKSGIGTNPGTLYAMKLNNDHNFPPIHAEIYNGNPLIYPIDANKNTISTEVILLKKTGLAGIFSASLELTKEGLISIIQNKNLITLNIKEKK